MSTTSFAKRLSAPPQGGTMGTMTTTLGERTKRARESLGMSLIQVDKQTALALGRKSNSLYNLIADVEGAGRQPTADVLAAMAQVLGVSPGWLLAGVGPMKASGAAGPTYGELAGWTAAAAVEERRDRVRAYAIRAAGRCPVLVTPREVSAELVYGVASLWLATASDADLAAARAE